MGQQQLITAIGRIERALSRIERSPMPGQTAGPDTALLQQHERLKAATRNAIADLDALIAAQSR